MEKFPTSEDSGWGAVEKTPTTEELESKLEDFTRNFNNELADMMVRVSSQAGDHGLIRQAVEDILIIDRVRADVASGDKNGEFSFDDEYASNQDLFLQQYVEKYNLRPEVINLKKLRDLQNKFKESKQLEESK